MTSLMSNALGVSPDLYGKDLRPIINMKYHFFLEDWGIRIWNRSLLDAHIGICEMEMIREK